MNNIVFGDLYKVPSRNGINRPSAVRGKGFKMINMGELFANDRIYDIEMELVLLNDKEKTNFGVKANDLLFARQSIIADGAGKCSIVLEVGDKATCFESHIIRVRLDESKACSLFYYYFFQSQIGKGYLSTIRQQGVQAGIRGSELNLLKLPFYNLITQQKIAAILSAYDDLIENNLKRIKLLEEQAQLTYEEWFVRLKFPGHKTTPINPETGLPEGWERKTLAEECILTMGQSPKSIYYNNNGEGLPFHQGVKDYGYRFPINNTWSTSGNRIAEAKDILFSVRAPVGRLNVAIEKIILGRGLASIKHKKGLTSFIYYQLKNIFINTDMIGGGAIFNSVTKADLKRIKLIIGATSIFEKFNELASNIDEEIKNLTKQNKLLKEARDILLPRLMTGRIDVNELDVYS